MRIESSIQQSYTKITTGSKINSAANDPSGLAISNKLTSQINGYDRGTENTLSSQDLVKTADSGLSSISESLQRMRELAVQASNGTLINDDRKTIQKEIGQLKEGIQQAVVGTEFNTMKLLDGSYSDKTVAASPNGTGKTMSIENTSLETLGIENFDVSGTFDTAQIDQALQKVSESRSNLGSLSNSMDHMVNSNNTTAQNLRASQSKLADTDVAKTLSELKTLNIIQNVQMYAQKQKMNQSASVLNLLG